MHKCIMHICIMPCCGSLSEDEGLPQFPGG